ncbi:MAG: sensor histidine kinase [Verrucomicrobiales bacterium]
MSDIHHALVLGLEGDGMAEAAEAIRAAGFTVVKELTADDAASQSLANLTLFATSDLEKKRFKRYSASQLVCLSRFSGEAELSGIEKLKPVAILPIPGLVPYWREIYQQTLGALQQANSKKGETLLRSLYSIASKAAANDDQTNIPVDPVAAPNRDDLEKKLLSTQQEMQAFAYSVSHDLKAPLRAVYGFSKILADDFAEALPEEGKTFVDHIMANAQQMSSLLDDLLAFYRLGKNPPRKDNWNPTDAVKLLAAELKQSYKDRNIQIEIEPLPNLFADPNLMEVALRHLLANACKFTGPTIEAVVKVSGATRNDTIELLVEDNGVGFEMSHAAKLFQVFQRMHTSAEFPGNGIGLAMVKKVADMHGGKVWLESIPEQGTKVHFCIPVVP